MRTRLIPALVACGLAVTTLAGCTGAGDDGEPSSTPSAEETTSSTPTPDAPEGPQAAEDLVGDWRDDDVDWTVHFEPDGTFTEDFEGIEGFRTGTYEYDDGVVRMIGGDGNTDEGRVEGETLVFNLGTLTRQ